MPEAKKIPIQLLFAMEAKTALSLPISTAMHCYYLLLLLLTAPVVHGAISNPNFWNVTEQELQKLVQESLPDLKTASELGGIAKTCDTLPGYKLEIVHKLTNASVILMDEALFCADFPQTCDMTRSEKEEWILAQAAWFSRPHIQKTPKSIISHDEKSVQIARRACQAGRALLLPITDDNKDNDNNASPDWIDAKGTGNPNTRDHSKFRHVRNINGLIELQNALWEYMNEKTVSAVLAEHAKQRPQDPHFETVGYYAVLSLGFDIYWETKNQDEWVTYPAGALIRQATRRHPNPYGFIAPKEGALFEQILNYWGMRRDTPVNDDRFMHLPNPHCRRVNVQGTIYPRQVVDFGEIYADPDWPPGDNECLVHWGKTGTKLVTPLWKIDNREEPEENRLRRRRVREFLRQELEELPVIWNETWPAKEMNSARQRRTWEATNNWRIGKWSVKQVEHHINDGLLDGILGSKQVDDEKEYGVLDESEWSDMDDEL